MSIRKATSRYETSDSCNKFTQKQNQCGQLKEWRAAQRHGNERTSHQKETAQLKLSTIICFNCQL